MKSNPLIPPGVVPNALIPPIIPPPPSPSLGFQTWASDPRNAMLVQHAMIAPDAPLQPNAGQMSAVNPPQTMASSKPPGMTTFGPSNTPNYQQTMAQQDVKGLVSPGNLPIWNRPAIQNADGSHSSEYSTSFGDDNGREVLVPTIANGRFFTPNGQKPPEGSRSIDPATGKEQYNPSPQEKTMFQKAWAYAQNTGQNLGTFDNSDDADAYAQVLHNRGNMLNLSDNNMIPPMQRAASASGLPNLPQPTANPPSLPQMPARGGMPNLGTPAAPPVQSQTQADQGELQRLQSTGPGVNQIQNPWLKGLAKTGDVLASVFAPKAAPFIPGTTAHNQLLQNQASSNVARDQAASQAATQQQLDQANLAHTNAETTAIPINAALKQQAASGVLAQHGLKVEVGDDGATHVVPDEDSPVYQQQQAKEGLIQSQTDSFNAGVELKNAQTALDKSKNDPNSPAYKLAQQRLAVAQQNAGAAQTRAQAYMGNYLKGAYNTGLNGQALPGAPIISDDSGNQTVVGATNAGTAIKNQSNAAQFNDVHGALDSVESAARGLVAKGGSLNSPRVAAALAQPAGTLGQWLQGAGVKAGLSPEERKYVQSIASAHENVQALRKSAGGTATDSAVSKLDAMIPGASTPDLNYLLGQTGQIRATAERLGKGATTSTGGLTVKGQGKPRNNMIPPTQRGATGGVPVTTPDGAVHMFKDQASANQFKTAAGIK